MRHRRMIGWAIGGHEASGMRVWGLGFKGALDSKPRLLLLLSSSSRLPCAAACLCFISFTSFFMDRHASLSIATFWLSSPIFQAEVQPDIALARIAPPRTLPTSSSPPPRETTGSQPFCLWHTCCARF